MARYTAGYRYFPTPYLTPNTGNMAFDTGMVNPLFEVQGRGMIPHRQFGCRLQGGQMLTALNVVKAAHVANGGLIAGQIISQPLSPKAQ